MKKPSVTHKPGPGGLFGAAALCGAIPEENRILYLHEWDYNCVVCRAMSGERT